MAQKKSRKELLRKQDEFVTLSQRLVNWVTENRTTSIIIGCSIIVAITLALTGKMLYSSHQEKQRQAFQRAFDLAVKPDKSDEAMKALEAFLKSYGGGDLGPMARLSLGRLYFEKGEFDKAYEEYDKALPRLKDRPDIVPLAVLDMASSLEAKGEYEKAVQALLAIKDRPGNYLKEETLFQITRLYGDMGAEDKVKASGEELLKEFPASAYSGLVEKAIGVK